MSLSPEINHAGDEDSLFGSPPSSPTRGRSPSPLALPSGTAQNVGTLALPGSHLVAELPVTPPASLSLTASAPAPSRQPAPPPTRVPFQLIGSSMRRNAPDGRSEAAPRRSRKGKEKERSTTPRPAPPISLPAADETPPPNFLRNQQALLGLAGMIGRVHPANLPKPRDARGTTAADPIVVEEEPSLLQHVSIDHPGRLGYKGPFHLPHPTSEQILGSLLQQKNVFPVVVSLLRLLAPGAPSLASVPPTYPYHSYPHQTTTTSFWSRSQSPEQGGDGPGMSVPPLKRRKLSSVPAGAADWDVPYPFEEGQGPENYRMNWERERSKQLLADLVQLVKGAAQKAATKTSHQQQQAQRRYHGRGVVVGYGPEPTVNKYYRPKTMYYGLDRGPVAPPRLYYPHPPNPFTVPAFHISGTSTPTTYIPSGSDAGLPSNSLSFVSLQDPNQPTQEVPQLSSVAFDQLVESLLSAQQHQEQHVADPSVGSPTPAADSASSLAAPSFTSEDNTQALFDNWLEMLTAFPPGDPNEGAAASPTSPTLHANVGATSSGVATDSSTPPDMADMATVDANTVSQIPDCLIDPALLDLEINSVTKAAPTKPTSTQLPSPNSGAEVSTPAPAPTTNNGQSATPSLVDSPTVTAASLPDATDTGPATPTWGWPFSEGHDAPSETTLDMKAFEQWAGMDVDMDMDVDVGAIIEEQLASAAPMATTVSSSSTAVSGAPSASPQLGMGSGLQSRQHVQSGPCLPQEDALRQGLGAQGVPALEHGGGDMTAQTAIPHSNAPSCSHASTGLPAPTALGVVPTPFVSSVAHAMATSARDKGKAKAVPSTGNGAGMSNTSVLSAGRKQDRRAVLERARKLRASLAAEVERAKVALWETTLEQGVLVGFGRELEKEGQVGR